MTRLTEQLTAAWNLTSNSTTAAAHFRRWRTAHPELDDIATIAELAEARRTGQRDQANTLVTLLLHEAGTGDALATETIFHALRYVALTVWRTYTPAGRRIGDDALCEVLTDIVEVVADLAASGASAYRSAKSEIDSNAALVAAANATTTTALTMCHGAP